MYWFVSVCDSRLSLCGKCRSVSGLLMCVTHFSIAISVPPERILFNKSSQKKINKSLNKKKSNNYKSTQLKVMFRAIRIASTNEFCFCILLAGSIFRIFWLVRLPVFWVYVSVYISNIYVYITHNIFQRFCV